MASGARSYVRRQRPPAVALFVAILCSGGAGFAADEAPGTAEPVRSAAEAAYDRAIASYAAGDKASALADMKESYRLSALPDLLYNVARLERELGVCRPALDDYREFLRAKSTGTFVSDATLAIADLEKQCGEPPAAAAAPVPPRLRYWTPPKIIGWSAIGAGVAAGAAAVAFRVLAESSHDKDQALATQLSDQNTSTGSGPPRPVYDSTYRDEARQALTLAWVFAVSSGVLVAGGITCLTLLSRPHEAAPPSVSFAVDSHGGSIGYVHEF